MSDSNRDIWSQWLLHRRHGGDPQQLQTVLAYLRPIRDKVLQGADVRDNDIVLDVGCGDGLIAFGALGQNATCTVIFSDISQDLLDHAQATARDMGVLERATFLQAAADDLSLLSDASVDVVTTRSVLIYVAAKQQAFNEFHRVLKPEGRLSIFEPINRFAYPEPPHLFSGYDVTPVMHIAQKVEAVYRHLQPPESDPMLNFDERDLIAWAEQAGFSEVHLELQVKIGPPPADRSWELFLASSGNPKIPSLKEAIEQSLTRHEADAFLSHLRPLVENKQGIKRSAVAYLWAVK